MAKGKTFTALYERLSHDDELQGESNTMRCGQKPGRNWTCLKGGLLDDHCKITA